MFMVVIGTFEWESFQLVNKIPKKDILIIIIVTTITVVEDLAIAVITGIIISALIFAWEKGKKIAVRTEIRKDGAKVSAVSFKELFTPKEDPKEVYIDFANSYVSDHSAIEAINAITEKYSALNKKIHLKFLSPDCLVLLKNAEEIIEVNVLEDPRYRVADDSLA